MARARLHKPPPPEREVEITCAGCAGLTPKTLAVRSFVQALSNRPLTCECISLADLRTCVGIVDIRPLFSNRTESAFRERCPHVQHPDTLNLGTTISTLEPKTHCPMDGAVR
jgi:hypothetical protein